MKTVKVYFHSLRGKKLALASIKKSALEITSTFVFVMREAFGPEPKVGDFIELEDNFKYKPLVNGETGEIVTSDNGTPLLTIEML